MKNKQLLVKIFTRPQAVHTAHQISPIDCGAAGKGDPRSLQRSPHTFIAAEQWNSSTENITAKSIRKCSPCPRAHRKSGEKHFSKWIKPSPKKAKKSHVNLVQKGTRSIARDEPTQAVSPVPSPTIPGWSWRTLSVIWRMYLAPLNVIFITHQLFTPINF